MTSNRNRQRHRLQPLTMREVVAAPGLGGLGDVLRAMVRPEGEPSGLRPATAETIPVQMSPGDNQTPGDNMTPGVTVSPGDARSPDDMESPAEVPSPGPTLIRNGGQTAERSPSPNSPQFVPQRPDLIRSRPGEKAHKWTLAQHGLTTTEFAVYSCLFSTAKPGPDPEYRDCSLSIGGMRKQTGLPDRTCQRAVHGLRAKQVIEIVRAAECEAAKPPIYRVKSYPSIMQTWRDLGFTHVAAGRGRYLIDPDNPGRRLGEHSGAARRQLATSSRGAIKDQAPAQMSPGDNMTPGDMSSPGDVNSPGVIMSPGDTVSPGPGDNLSGEPGDTMSPLIGNKNRNKYRKTDPSTAACAVDRTAVAAALGCYGPADDAAVNRIVDASVACCPQCETEDIVLAVQRKGESIQKQAGIQNPIGIMISTCPDLVAAARKERLAAETERSAAEAVRQQAAAEERIREYLRGLPADNPWSGILGRLKATVPQHSFSCFLQPTRFAGIRKRTLLVHVPGEEFRSIDQKWAAEIRQAIEELALPVDEVRCLTTPELAAEKAEASCVC